MFVVVGFGVTELAETGVPSICTAVISPVGSVPAGRVMVVKPLASVDAASE